MIFENGTNKRISTNGMNKRMRLMAVLLICLITLFCQKQEPFIARVGNSVLTKKELDAQIPEGAFLTRENLPIILDKWINSELLYQEAKRQGLDKKSGMQIQLKQLVKEYLANQLLEQIQGQISVSQAEILSYFTKHKEDFLSEVKIMRIVLPDEVIAQKTLEELSGGRDFAELARERSIDKVLEKGVPTKYFSRGVGDPTLEEAIFALKPGAVSEVIKTQEGYQIIKLIDKKKVKKDIPFSEVKEYIESVLTLQKGRQYLDSLLQSLKSKTKIETKPENYFIKQ